jgi:hypothetical protein
MSTSNQTPDIDLSAGFIPKSAGTTARPPLPPGYKLDSEGGGPASQGVDDIDAPGGKAVPRSLVQQYADAHKVGSRPMRYDEALKGFQSKGYTIVR